MFILNRLRERLAELQERRNALLAEVDTIYQAARSESRSNLIAAEDEAVRAAETELASIEAEERSTNERIALYEAQAAAAARSHGARPSVPGARRPDDALGEIRSMTPGQLADQTSRSMEANGASDEAVETARRVLLRHRSDRQWAINMAIRASEVYADAWAKLMTGRAEELTPEERAAVAVGTAAQGGYLVPTHLDPTIILTNSGSSNVMRRLATVRTLTTGIQWNGVTSAGVTMSWDPELTEVSDDSPTFGTAGIPVYKAQGFVQASDEALEDIAGLTGDIAALLADARDRLEAAAHMTGSGSSQPTGIFTAITGAQSVVSATAATIALADLQGLRRALPVRWRNRATWVMNPVYADAIKALGTALSANYSGDITQANTGTLLGRPVVESDEAPSTQTTTVKDPEIMYGDFSSYVIVDKPGSTSLQFVPTLFNTANNLPDGRQGWFMRFRTGADSVNDAAFRLLVDRTSA